jgi:hypothetical protein
MAQNSKHLELWFIVILVIFVDLLDFSFIVDCSHHTCFLTALNSKVCNVLPLHLKHTFLPIIQIFSKVKGRDQIQTTFENLFYFTQFYNCYSDPKLINHEVS